VTQVLKEHEPDNKVLVRALERELQEVNAKKSSDGKSKR
jgi:hypothetical protein